MSKRKEKDKSLKSKSEKEKENNKATDSKNVQAKSEMFDDKDLTAKLIIIGAAVVLAIIIFLYTLLVKEAANPKIVDDTENERVTRFYDNL